MSRTKPRRDPPANVIAFLKVDPQLPCTLTDQVCVAIRDGIASGALSPGMRMPSTRELAQMTGLARNTILNAYDELRRQGILAARRGSGTVIAAATALAPTAAAKKPASRSEMPKTALPHAPALPYRSWHRAMRSSLQTMAKRSDHARAAREAMANYFAVRGIRCAPDNILFAPSPRQSIDLALRTIAATQRVVLIEDPGIVFVQKLVLQNHLTPAPLPIDSLGANIAAGLRDLREAHAAYVTPSHQHPLGIVMADERREALAVWADLANAWIIEDDIAATLRQKHSPPLYSTSGRTIHLGTFAYATLPLSMMSYVVVPDALVERASELSAILGIEVPVAEQLAMRQLILSRSYQRSLEAARAEAAQRHEIVTLACERHLLWFAARVTGSETGERAVLWLQHPFDPVMTAGRLREHGLPVDRLQEYAMAPVRDALVLRLERIRTEDIEDAIRRIGTIVRETAGENGMLPGCLPKSEAPRYSESIRS